MQEHQKDKQRTDDARAEHVYAVESAAQSAHIGEFVVCDLLGHVPSHEETGEESAQWQEEETRDGVEPVEQRLAGHGQEIPVAQRQRAQRGHYGAYRGDYRRCLLAAHVALLVEVCRAHFMKRDYRGERCKGEQGVEAQGNQIVHYRHAAESLFEHVGQRDEDERRTRIGTDAHRECRREDNQSGEYRHHRIDYTYLYGAVGKISVARIVGGEGAEASHTDAQREERLTDGVEEHILRHLGEVGIEQELYSSPRIRQHAGSHDDDDEQQEERRHEQLGCLLDTVLHTADDDEMRYAEEYDSPEDRLPWVFLEQFEIAGEIFGAAMQMTHGRGIDVMEAPAGDYGIEARHDDARKHAGVADQRPWRLAGKLAECSGGIALRTASDDELADDARHTEQENAEDVDKDKHCTAVLSRHIGETPHVA